MLLDTVVYALGKHNDMPSHQKPVQEDTGLYVHKLALGVVQGEDQGEVQGEVQGEDQGNEKVVLDLALVLDREKAHLQHHHQLLQLFLVDCSCVCIELHLQPKGREQDY